MRSPFSIDKCFMVVAALAFLSAADVFGGVISVLHEPVSDGAYELGKYFRPPGTATAAAACCA